MSCSIMNIIMPMFLSLKIALIKMPNGQKLALVIRILRHVGGGVNACKIVR